MPNSLIPNMEKLPGAWQPASIPALQDWPKANLIFIAEGILVLENGFSREDCEQLQDFIQKAPKQERVDAFGKRLVEAGAETKGSLRVSVWNEALAEQLWLRLKPFVSIRILNDFSASDWWQENGGYNWQPVGLSPLLRFMTYEKGTRHLPHYDSSYIYPNSNYRSLMSVLIYLSDNKSSGATRILEDGQSHLPVQERVFEDWTKEAREEEVFYKVNPEKGKVFCFDHRLCHDAELYLENNPRSLIRCDLVFKKIEI